MASKTDINWKDVSPAPGAQADSMPGAQDARPSTAGRSQRDRNSAVENSIAPALERPKERDTAETDKEPPNEVKRAADSSSQAMPGHIATRYVRVDNKYHFPNGGKPAFTDNATKLTTRLENTEVIADLVEIARERGWTNIAIAGTKTFKAEVWQQANLAGLTVRGYRPSKLEEAMLERRRGPDVAPDTVRANETSPSARPTERPARTDAEETREWDRQAGQVPLKNGVYTGKLVERGSARSPEDPTGNPVPYIRLRSGKTEKLLWGEDLERAVVQSKSQVAMGQEITARFVGPTVRSRPVLDGSGSVVREERVDPNLTRWSVESTEFLRERAELAKAVRDPAVTKESAVRQFPALAGTYTELHAAELKAIQQFKGPEDRARFVERMRAKLAEGIERGEPLPVTRVKPRTQSQSSSPPQARDLVQERVLG